MVIFFFEGFRSTLNRTQCLGAFFRWYIASKSRALGAVANAPDPVSKNPGGDFELNQTQTNPES